MAKPTPKPIRVAYNIARMSAGGANGGIKTHHYEFLRRLSEVHGHQIALVVICQPELVTELDFLAQGPSNHIIALGPKPDLDLRDHPTPLPPVQFWPELPENFLESIGIDVLYAGFGFSHLQSPNIPLVSLVVDLIHRDIPDALPEGEINYREKHLSETLRSATRIQANSDFIRQSLKNNFQVPDAKIETIYLPLHNRFIRVEMGDLPAALAPLHHRYFLYPANFWPHKNHANLLHAYAAYLKTAPEPAHHLALTGFVEENGRSLQQLSQELELEKHVHFLGHQDLAGYKAIWELAAALVFPSRYEGFGLPLIEAAFFQKPVACSHVASIPEVAPTNAVQFDPDNPTSIADALLELHRDPDAHRAAPDHLVRFQLDVEVKKLVALLQSAKR